MGDDLHLRAGGPIGLDAWLAVATASPLVEPDPTVAGNRLPPFRLVADPDGPVLFWTDDGRIVVRGVEETSLPHLVDLVAALGPGWSMSPAGR